MAIVGNHNIEKQASFWRKSWKRLANKIIPRITRKYLSKTRKYRFKELSLTIPPGVFHPGIYFSTRILVDYLAAQDLSGKRLIELGAGSGMISISAAKAGAIVTATDISPLAIEAIRNNAAQNNADLTVIHSDLFASIPAQSFDWMVINPPYFPGEPENMEQYAWYCGPDFEYFDGLFGVFGDYLAQGGKAIMILSEDCQLDRIREIAGLHGVAMELILMKKVMGERNYLYALQAV